VSRTVRWWVLGVGLAGVGALFLLAFLDLPSFGSSFHPYRDAAVPAAVRHSTPNVVASINFDQRGWDTFGEETILFGSVLAVAALLRPSAEERLQREPGSRTPLEVTRLFGYALLPLTVVVGLDMVAHGHLTPGGGFQGGIMLATAIHLLYVSGRYRSLDRLRPLNLLEAAEAAGTAAYAATGLAGIAVSGSFLANVAPLGTFGRLFSAGTVPLLNVAVGLAVASGGIVLLAQFFQQVFLVTKDAGKNAGKAAGTDADEDADEDAGTVAEATG
jgi:multicomponent Na+:H+ antiporter subunit B